MMREGVIEKEHAEGEDLNAEGAKAFAVERVDAEKMAENFMVKI